MLAACTSDNEPRSFPHIDMRTSFIDHGVITNIAASRGTVATTGVDGHKVVLSWLFDHRGCYALLYIDVTTGTHEQIPIPFVNSWGDAPYASILSSDNKLYTYFDSYFIEFDPLKKAFTFIGKTFPKAAMSFTEDSHGIIWAASYPNGNLVAYSPHEKSLKEYGTPYKQDWAQFPRYIASDSAGWIYISIGSAKMQIMAFNPYSGERKPLLSDNYRSSGIIQVYKGADKNVYAKFNSGQGNFKLYDGNMIRINTPPPPANIIAGTQDLHYDRFPDGSVLRTFNLIDRYLQIQQKTGETINRSFDYTTDGAVVMGVAAGPDDKIYVSTAFPMKFAIFNPRSNGIENFPAIGQFNALRADNKYLYFAAYPYGQLLEWNPRKAYVATLAGSSQSNPILLSQNAPTINRPSSVLVLTGSSKILMAGTPGYGYTGGGLLVWDTTTTTADLLKDTQLAVDQSIMAMVDLGNQRILFGTTTDPGSGGIRKAGAAELFVLDIVNKKVEFRHSFPGVHTIDDLVLADNGLIYGFADLRTFFAFDPKSKTVIFQRNSTMEFGNIAMAQGPRTFVKSRNGTIYVLFRNKIGRINQHTNHIDLVANSPVTITAGGAYLDGSLYFASKSHLYSFKAN